MADRYPLIANSATNKIEELADGDNLNLDGNDIVNVENITVAGSLTAGGLSFPTTNGTSGYQLTSDGAGNVTWEAAGTGGGSGSSTFLGLTDTPANFNSQAGKYLKVSAGANGLEFTDINYADLTNQPSIPSAYGDSDVDTHLNQSNPTSGHVLSWNGSDYAWVAQSGGGGGGSTTINNNADNRLITGSGTAGTLEGEANLTYDGTDLTCGGKVEDSKGDVRSLGGTGNITTAYTITDRSYVGRVINTTANVTVDGGALQNGDAITIYNNSSSPIAISQGTASGSGSVALLLAGTNSGGTRALAATGIATILCIDNTTNNFVVTGSGVT